MKPQSIEEMHEQLLTHDYIAERGLETAVFLSLKLEKPLFLEGEAGVGKTEVAKVLARILDTRLIRLQCYEGLDAASALYEWDYARQLLHLRVMEASGAPRDDIERSLYSREFLLTRPLLQALEASSEGRAPVLLIDELDRADEEFEAFLLELLSDFQVTVPELGTIHAQERPVVILTSNRTREIHDALKRRCLYHWIDYPSFQRELAIVRAKRPQAGEELARQVTALVQELRSLELFKAPGVAETLDWTSALIALDRHQLDEQVVEDTLGAVLKYQDDIQSLSPESLKNLLHRSSLRARQEK
ncbi:MAG TPA: MoxR family ATPase [Acidobacteriota bacterium]|nr:MoxR family ATPase [Acidobacteriota bacterium]